MKKAQYIDDCFFLIWLKGKYEELKTEIQKSV